MTILEEIVGVFMFVALSYLLYLPQALLIAPLKKRVRQLQASDFIIPLIRRFNFDIHPFRRAYHCLEKIDWRKEGF